MLGQRVCIPKRYQARVLEELHHGHLGIVKMKAIARSYVYWNNIDKDIENTAKNCVDCAQCKTDPPRVKVHYWEYPSTPWERIHVDFAGPIFEHMFLIIVDAHSKWLEVYPMRTTTATKTIECLRDCFARFGLPLVLVSDNGPQFTSSEFNSFMRNNGIKHKTTAPFKPSSNGQAERYVFTVKQSLRAMQNYGGTIQQKLSTFLMQYRKAPNLTTLHSPAMLMMKREIRTRIDLLRPDLKSRVEGKVRKGTYEFSDRGFQIGDKVAVRNYRQGDKRWRFGRVLRKEGQLHYTVDVNGQFWRRHVDQMRDGGDIEDCEFRRPAAKPAIPMQNADAPMSDVESPAPLPASTESEEIRMTPAPTPTPVQTSISAKGSAQTPRPLRRSTRVRKPPKRLNL